MAFSALAIIELRVQRPSRHHLFVGQTSGFFLPIGSALHPEMILQFGLGERTEAKRDNAPTQRDWEGRDGCRDGNSMTADESEIMHRPRYLVTSRISAAMALIHPLSALT
jgi:hypothetical protein